MSLEALVTGKLIRDAEAKTSASGRPYALLLVAAGDDTICRAMLFGDDCERFCGLKRGDAISLVGALQVGIWNEKPSLSLLAHRAISPSERKAPRPKEKPDMQGQFKAAAVAQREPAMDRQGDGLDGPLPWEKKTTSPRIYVEPETSTNEGASNAIPARQQVERSRSAEESPR